MPRNTLHLTLLAALASGPSWAFEWGLEASGGYTWSDNVAQAPQGESASIAVTEVAAALEHESGSLRADAEANYIHRYFIDGDHGSESLPQLRAELEWMPWPERLQLTLTDTYGQLSLNPAEGLLPSQYENANVFTAGPTFFLPLSPDTRVLVSGEYRTASFEESDVDTERKTGRLALERDLTRLISVHGTASHSRTDFDLAGERSGYDASSAVVGFNGVGRRSTLTVDSGWDSVRDQGRTFTGATFNVGYERRLSRRATLYVSALRDSADAADVFTLGQVTDPALANIRDVQVTSQPLQRTSYRIGYAWAGPRITAGLLFGRRREDYEVPPENPNGDVGQDRSIREAGIEVSYLLGPQTSLGASVDLLRERFANGVRSDDLLGSLSYLRQLTRTLGLEAEMQRIERQNSPRDFEEMRLFLRVRYVARRITGRETHLFDRAFEQYGRRARASAAEDPADLPRDDAP